MTTAPKKTRRPRLRDNTGSKIDDLPLRLQDAICEKLFAGGSDNTYRAIAEWLFGQPDDDAVPCSSRWLTVGQASSLPAPADDSAADASAASHRARALHACENAIHRYYGGKFQGWRNRKLARDDDFRAVDFVKAKLGIAGEGGRTDFLEAALFETLWQLRQTVVDPEKKAAALTTLTHAIGSIAEGQREDLKLQQGEKKIEQSAEKLQFEREKWESGVAEKALDTAKQRKLAEIAASNLPRAEQIAAARKVYFSDIDALEASGKVVLPT